MHLTLITATYNSAKTLTDTMDSVLGQDYGDLEYLLIDGNSSDNSVELIQKRQEQDPRIRFISEPDKGIYDALNKGVELARGDVIGFVHSDDFLASPDILSAIMDRFKVEEADGVYGDLQYITPSRKVLRNWKSDTYHRKKLQHGWMPAHPTLFLKKEVYQKHGLFDLNYRIAADYDFMLRILKDDSLKFCYLPRVVTKMRTGGASNRSLKNLWQKSKEDYRAIKGNKLPQPLRVLLAKNFTKLPQFLQ